MDWSNCFKVSPTFFSFIAGIIVSLATNLLTSMLLKESESSVYLATAVFLLGASATAFLIVTLKLEAIKEHARGSDTGPHIRTAGTLLGISVAFGLTSLIASFCMMYLAGLS